MTTRLDVERCVLHYGQAHTAHANALRDYVAEVKRVGYEHPSTLAKLAQVTRTKHEEEWAYDRCVALLGRSPVVQAADVPPLPTSEAHDHAA